MTRLRASPDRIERRAARLAAIGAAAARPPQRAGVTRLGLTEEEQRAHALVGGWLERRGARIRSDAAGNLLARFDGSHELHGIELSDAGLELQPFPPKVILSFTSALPVKK